MVNELSCFRRCGFDPHLQIIKRTAAFAVLFIKKMNIKNHYFWVIIKKSIILQNQKATFIA
jgi:hypothetical protein